MPNAIRLLSLGLLLSLSACKKDKTVTDPPVTSPAPANQAKVVVDVSNVWGFEDLVFQKKYVNPKGDTVSITKFMYYISNVELLRDDGTKYTEAESYHLVDHTSASSKSFTLSNVPEGVYSSISFVIGVDSVRNCSGAQTGALDPAKGMFWTWNSGYIFLKVEGKAPKSPGNASITYHIGGFKGVNKAQRQVNLSFSTTLLKAYVSADSHLGLKANLRELFQNPSVIDVSTTYYQMGEGAGAKYIADNYMDMFSISSVTNP
jgi:hypothetical protein